MSMYEYIDHPSDVIIQARGNTFEQALSAAAIAMFNYMCNLDDVEEVLTREILIERLDDPKQLFYVLMDECLYLYGSEYFIAKHLTIQVIDNQLKISLKGDIFDTNKHVAGREIKAITKHGITVDIQDDSTTLMILVDI